MRIKSGPAQWVGVALILGWSVLLAFGLPRWAAAIPAEQAVEAGQAVSVGGVSLTPVEGWGIAPESTEILILRKQGAQLTALPPRAATGDASAEVATAMAAYADDPSTDWKVSDPAEFTTAAGAPGVYSFALAPQQFIANYVVVIDGQTYQVLVNGTDTDWTTLHDEILDTVSTLEPAGAGA